PWQSALPAARDFDHFIVRAVEVVVVEGALPGAFSESSFWFHMGHDGCCDYNRCQLGLPTAIPVAVAGYFNVLLDGRELCLQHRRVTAHDQIILAFARPRRCPPLHMNAELTLGLSSKDHDSRRQAISKLHRVLKQAQ